MASSLTTLKVRAFTRDWIRNAARARGMTVDDYLTAVLEELAWREHVSMARVAMAEPDEDYRDQVAAWDPKPRRCGMPTGPAGGHLTHLQK